MADEDQAVVSKECGAFVVMKTGKRYLFAIGASRWEPIVLDGGIAAVRVFENEAIAFEAPWSNVDCVGGHTWFFKDSWWSRER